MAKIKPKAKPDAVGSGILYVVSTPIGNLDDITLRALSVLKEADVIACEDTRRTLKLLTHFEISKRLVSYHEHNELMRAPEIVIDLEQGAKVALVTDAGTPAISDPGHRLVSLCLRHGIKVVPIPGASAFVAALSASGLPTEEFTFAGFCLRVLPSVAKPFENSRRSPERSRCMRRPIVCWIPWRMLSKSSATGPP